MSTTLPKEQQRINHNFTQLAFHDLRDGATRYGGPTERHNWVFNRNEAPSEKILPKGLVKWDFGWCYVIDLMLGSWLQVACQMRKVGISHAPSDTLSSDLLREN